MNATPVTKGLDREAIRLLVLELGYKLTSERTNIKEPTLRKWAERGSWFNAQTKQTQRAVTSVTKPGNVLVSELQGMEERTRMSLARSAEKLATEAESAKLRQVGDVHKVAQVMAIVHRQDQDKPGAQFSLNVLNLNMFSDEQPQSLDA